MQLYMSLFCRFSFVLTELVTVFLYNMQKNLFYNIYCISWFITDLLVWWYSLFNSTSVLMTWKSAHDYICIHVTVSSNPCLCVDLSISGCGTMNISSKGNTKYLSLTHYLYLVILMKRKLFLDNCVYFQLLFYVFMQ